MTDKTAEMLVGRGRRCAREMAKAYDRIRAALVRLELAACEGKVPCFTEKAVLEERVYRIELLADSWEGKIDDR